MLYTMSEKLVLSKGLYTRKVEDHSYITLEDVNITTIRAIRINDAGAVNSCLLATESLYTLSTFLRLEQYQVCKYHLAYCSDLTFCDSAGSTRVKTHVDNSILAEPTRALTPSLSLDFDTNLADNRATSSSIPSLQEDMQCMSEPKTGDSFLDQNFGLPEHVAVFQLNDTSFVDSYGAVRVSPGKSLPRRGKNFTNLEPWEAINTGYELVPKTRFVGCIYDSKSPIRNISTNPSQLLVR
jgi:hypothetical protein